MVRTAISHSQYQSIGGFLFGDGPADSRLGEFHLDVIGDFKDHDIVLDTHHRSEDAAGGHYPVPFLELAEHGLMLPLLFLLGTDHKEIDDEEDELGIDYDKNEKSEEDKNRLIDEMRKINEKIKKKKREKEIAIEEIERKYHEKIIKMKNEYIKGNQ